MIPTTFADALESQRRADGARPLVTFYDDATGERVELSVTTYANWVAKTAGLLQDELEVERGARVLLDLPTHWLGPVWLGAIWSVGAVAVEGVVDGPADLVVSGPDRLAEHAAGEIPVVGLSLRPLGARFAEAPPAGVVDYGAVVWGQPDAFACYDPPTGADAAWEDPQGVLTQAELLQAASREGQQGLRLLTDLNPCSGEGWGTLLRPLLAGGGTVWVRHPDTAGWERRAAAEQATAVERQPSRS